LIAILFLQLIPKVTFSDEAQSSSITFLISVDLSVVEERVNKALPTRLETIHKEKELCVPTKRVKYKYPCFKGWKWYSCDGWTKVSPDIYCDIDGYVDKRGDLTINGSGETLVVSLPVRASGSAKATGVSETAKADATFFVSATPTLSENWELSVDLSSDFRWDKRPTLKILDLITVTIGSMVEPKLREKMKEIENKIISAIDELDIRGRVNEVWLEVQKPIQLSLTPEAWVTFRPLGVAYSGISVSNKRLETQITVSGDARVLIGPRPVVGEPVALLPLQHAQFEDGHFNLAVPVMVKAEEIQRAINSQLENSLTIEIDEGDLQGSFTASNFQVLISEAKGIRLIAEVGYDNRSAFLRTIDVFGWFDFEGSMELEILPQIDGEKNLLLVEHLRISSETSSILADTLITVINLQVVRNIIAGIIRYDFSRELANTMEMAEKAMNFESKEGLRISGNLEAVGVDRLQFQDGAISFFTTASGTVQAFLRR